MSELRKIAIPILEGFTETGQETKVLWQDHRWNTGETTRTWLVDPASVDDLTIRERAHRFACEP